MPLSTEDGTLSPELEALIRGPGNALPGLLLVAPAGGTADARDVAVQLARAWVRTGRRIVLVDLGLDAPALHEPLGARNEEGIADHFEFGTSLERLAQPVEDGSWGLIPAGAYTPDPAAVAAAPEWRSILRDAARRDATFLLYAPADLPGLATLSANVGALLDIGGAHQLEGLRPYSVLGGFGPAAPPAPEPEAEPLPEADAEPVPDAVLEPELAAEPLAWQPRAFEFAPVAPAEPEVPFVEPQPPEPEPASPAEPEAPARPEAWPERLSEADYERIRLPKDARTREALIADLRARQRAALMQPPADAYRPALADAETPPPVPRPGELAGALSPEAAGTILEPVPLPSDFQVLEPPARQPEVVAVPGNRRPLLYSLIAVLLLSFVAAAWHFTGVWLDARREREEAARAVAPVVRTPPAAPAQPATDTVLGYAVALEAHQQLPDARQRVQRLRTAMAEPGFFIAPLVREEALYYHVMAGPVRDSATAAALMDSLLARRFKTGGTPADVRHAPLAFLLGEFATADSASTRVTELERFDIPAYVVPLGGPPARWRVYAGGYTGAADADVMRQLLQSAGAPDSLVPRIGRATRPAPVAAPDSGAAAAGDSARVPR